MPNVQTQGTIVGWPKANTLVINFLQLPTCACPSMAWRCYGIFGGNRQTTGGERKRKGEKKEESDSRFLFVWAKRDQM